MSGLFFVRCFLTGSFARDTPIILALHSTPNSIESSSMLPPLVQCPYCGQEIEFFVDPDTVGSYVEDCEVCCRPWAVQVSRDEEGNPQVFVDRAQ